MTVRTDARAVALRPAEMADEAFLRRVYASARESELSLVVWTAEEKDAFLRQQFDQQDAYYRTYYDGASFEVIEASGRPVGRLYVARWPDEIRIMDITVLPEYRGDGIGTRLLSELVEEGARTGKRVSVHVEKGNPAFRLYERLGFEVAADKGLYLLMEATP